MHRRKLLKGVLAGTGVLLSGAVRAESVMKACGLTPPQTEGPFYPIDDQFDKDTDLTFVQGRSARALGEVVVVKGVVQNQACRPIAGALVEIWQACASGRYNHPSDPNTSASLDPNFQYWGKTTTNSKGEYQFKTIIPGAYPAAPGWDRPPHIHFKVQLRGFEELTTQMYFEGHPLNTKDLILNRFNSMERRRVVIDFKTDGAFKTGFFPITLKAI